MKRIVRTLLALTLTVTVSLPAFAAPASKAKPKLPAGVKLWDGRPGKDGKPPNGAIRAPQEGLQVYLGCCDAGGRQGYWRQGACWPGNCGWTNCGSQGLNNDCSWGSR